MLKIINNKLQTLSSVGLTTYGAAMSMAGVSAMSVQSAVTVNAAANPTFVAAGVNTTTGVITSTAHALVQGQLVTLTNSGGALPTGFATVTTYYVIYISANTFSLASSAANALAGTPIIPSTQGTGTQTVVQTALASATICLQKSNDGVTYTNEGTPTAITVTAGFFLEKAPVTSRWMRVAYVLASGQIQASTYPCLIGQIP